MRVFSPLRPVFVLALLLLSVPLALPSAATAQDANLCVAAYEAGAGASVQGYPVVSGSGGSGSQIVLSDGSGYLSGGSGNDVLCAWGGGNTLEGGSGNDVLIVMSGLGNELYGGSGNDTLIGFESDYFDGGSGRNSITAQPIAMQAWLNTNALNENGERVVAVAGSGFTPGAAIELTVGEYYGPDGIYGRLDLEYTTIVNFDGTFSVTAREAWTYAIWCAYESYFSPNHLYYIVFVVDSETSNLLYTSERYVLGCL